MIHSALAERAHPANRVTTGERNRVLFLGRSEANTNARRRLAGRISECCRVGVLAGDGANGEAVRLVEMIHRDCGITEFLNHGVAHGLQPDDHGNTQNRDDQQQLADRHDCRFVDPQPMCRLSVHLYHRVVFGRRALSNASRLMLGD